MNNHKITASIVLYNTPEVLINRLLSCILNSGCIDTIYIIDNSPSPKKQFAFENLPIEYIPTFSNLGYGSGHNIAIKMSIELGANFHLVLNPDISFDDGEINKMISRMQSDSDIGNLMPKVTNIDGSLQYLCKMLPTPLDLILRRFAVGPLKIIFGHMMDRFELRFTGYNREMNVPFLSGCFMLLRVSTLKEIGLFDESFFMYGEDIDLNRRMHAKYKTIFFPDASIVHDHAKASFKSAKMLWIHIINVVKYFNKWGWIFDKDRRVVNTKALMELDGR
ncbi:glycosyltransferase family 2 protein [Polynucleobacter paneuropaeus]|nr:glycosyltransferase family 2 protein [Polynucleobacter paneuropaeus]